VLTDHAPGVVEAVGDLRAHGHERIGLLSPPTYVRAGREVQAAFASAAGNVDLVRMGPLTERFGYQAASELLSQSEPPTGLVIAGTQVLVGVLTALNEFGLRVPNDLSIISYDDSAAARFHTPPISTLVRDCEQIGEFAARLVLERIDGRRTDLKKVFVPTVYEPRGSVAPPRARVLARARRVAG
jgi:LacI family transcriptional regulator